MISVTEIVLIIAGILAVVLGYLIPNGQDTDDVSEISEVRINELVQKALRNSQGQIDDMLEECMEDAINKAERAMDRVTNEKMSAISEYSDTVMNDIHKNHDEVMFMYDMLNDKHKNLKNTVSEVNRVAKEVKQTAEEAVMNAEHAEAAARTAREVTLKAKDSVKERNNYSSGIQMVQMSGKFEEPEGRVIRPAVNYEEPEDRVIRPTVNYEEPEDRVIRPTVNYEEPEDRVIRPTVNYEEPESRVVRPATGYEEQPVVKAQPSETVEKQPVKTFQNGVQEDEGGYLDEDDDFFDEPDVDMAYPDETEIVTDEEPKNEHFSSLTQILDRVDAAAARKTSGKIIGAGISEDDDQNAGSEMVSPQEYEMVQPANEEPAAKVVSIADASNKKVSPGNPDNGIQQFEVRENANGMNDPISRNQRILDMHKSGKSAVVIARELRLGIGEVKLVIDLAGNHKKR